MGCFNSTTGTSKGDIITPAKVSNSGVNELKMLYNIKNVLGSGSFGKVFLAENKADTSHKVAVKVISKQKLSQEEIEALHFEVAILQKVDHPNIVKYYETYEDDKFIYLVMELCPGGELIEKLTQSKTMSEKMAAEAIEKIIRSLIHCHKQNIVHRDIKPENVMYAKSGEVKLIDFGLAKQVSDKQKLHTVAGTPYFIAPEVLNGSYGKECDFWSVGVLLFLLITGTYPFDSAAKNRTEVFSKIKLGNYSIPANIDAKLSSECKDLMRKMITVDKSKRISGDDALKHPWFDCLKKKGEEIILDEEVITKLREFKGSSLLKRAALNLFVKMLNSEEVDQMRVQFQKIDVDNSGQIEIAELKEVLAQTNKKVSMEEFDHIIKELDYNGNEKINYSEFLAATITVQNIMTHQKFAALYRQFDVDGNDQITRENIKEAMLKLGREITDRDLDDIMEKHDANKDGFLSMEEFKTMLYSTE